jgi:transcription antitermination factor NusA-like protein
VLKEEALIVGKRVNVQNVITWDFNTEKIEIVEESKNILLCIK